LLVSKTKTLLLKHIKDDTKTSLDSKKTTEMNIWFWGSCHLLSVPRNEDPLDGIQVVVTEEVAET
jgi:hypothetical protein